MTNIYEALGATVEAATQHYVNLYSQQLAIAIFPYVSSAIGLWLTIMGFQALSGRLQQPFINVLERCGAMVLLSAVAFSPSIYQIDILDSFDQLQATLVSAVAGEDTNSYRLADVALQKGIDLGNEFSQETTVTGPETFFGWTVGSLLIYGGSALITLMAGGSILIAKASLAIVLAFGQVAIACAIFPMTRKLFDAFLTTVLNRILHVLFITMIMGFTLTIFTDIVAAYDPLNTEPLSFSAQLLVGVLVCVGLMKQAGTLASELAGGVALAVANPIAAAARIATSPTAAGLNYLSGKASRTNARTGQAEYASRASHILRGNTSANPAYRQKAMENMKGGWGMASGGSAKSSEPSMTPTEKLMAMHRRREEQSKN